jgi:hypothetical protein
MVSLHYTPGESVDRKRAGNGCAAQGLQKKSARGRDRVLKEIGGYLMVLPLQHNGSLYLILSHSGLSEWLIDQSFDSAAECEQAGWRRQSKGAG